MKHKMTYFTLFFGVLLVLFFSMNCAGTQDKQPNGNADGSATETTLLDGGDGVLDKSEAPDKFETVSDKGHTAQDENNTGADNSTVSDKNNASPDKSNTAPDKNNTAPDKSHEGDVADGGSTVMDAVHEGEMVSEAVRESEVVAEQVAGSEVTTERVDKVVEYFNVDAKGVAVKGYDVVAYFKQKKAVPGDSKWSVKWSKATWYFSSDQHRKLFLASPIQYAPQYAGYCAWAVSRGYTASIDPKAWKIVNQKLYLNYSLSIQKQWEQDIPKNIALADKNWPSLRRKP